VGGADQLAGRLPLRVMQDCLQVRSSSRDPRRARAASLLRSRRQDSLFYGDASVTGVEVLLTLADELCAAAPTVLVVDDQLWADEASLAVWHQLAVSISQLRAHPADANLDAAQIATAHHISVRHLYQFIAISHLARQWGFRDTSSFGRSFRTAQSQRRSVRNLRRWDESGPRLACRPLSARARPR
jgi:AraC-like DNA-binding protein